MLLRENAEQPQLEHLGLLHTGLTRRAVVAPADDVLHPGLLLGEEVAVLDLRAEREERAPRLQLRLLGLDSSHPQLLRRHALGASHLHACQQLWQRGVKKNTK